MPGGPWINEGKGGEQCQPKPERLAQLREQFDELTASLELSGKKRAGTTWQIDRLKAREQIRREMEALGHPASSKLQPRGRRLAGWLIAVNAL